MGKLEGKVVIITGATSGIGEASARLFAREGARLVLGGRREHLAERLASELGPAVLPLRMDVAREADIEAAVRFAVERFGRLDCMFNNAGSSGALGRIDETDTAALDQTVAVLFRAVILGIKHAARVMRAQGSGTIISTASVAGLSAGYAPHVYSACKAAVIQLTRSAAIELGEAGVRVNCICPGPIATPIFGTALGLDDDEAAEHAQRTRELFATMQPLKRAGEPSDVAQAALWLASDDAGFINGHALVVDGGLTAGQSWSAYRDYVRRLAAVGPRR